MHDLDLAARAQREVERLGHDHAGEEHYALALLADEDGPAVRVLRMADADIAGLRAEIEREASRGRRPGGDGARGLLESASAWAARLDEPELSPGAVLMALLTADGSPLAAALRKARHDVRALAEFVRVMLPRMAHVGDAA